MFNVTVLKMKDIIKYFICIVFILLLTVVISKNFNIKQNENNLIKGAKSKISILSEKSMIECIEKTIPVIKTINEEYGNIENVENKKEITEEKILKNILKTEISSMKSIYDLEEKNNKKPNAEDITRNENITILNEVQEQASSTQLIETEIKTEVITENPIKETYNVEYGKVKIKNQTSFDLTEEILTPNITIENKNILLFHTHSCESYTSSEKYSYSPTGTFRTTDLNFTVTRVGGELEEQLKQYGYNVIHNTDYHDYPSYNGSYTRSLATVENILKENPSDIIIDLHRDAIGSRSDYAPTVKIGDNDIAAQVMFVIGTNGGGLWHPNWNQNLKFAIKVQEKAEEMYPGLFKPIMLTESRYNQHTGKYASIIEVGATGNTLEQSLTSMKYLAKVINEILP